MATPQKALAKVLKTPLLTGHNEAFLPPLASGNHAIQLLAGPAAMLTAFGLQMVKKQLSGTHKNELWAHIWKFISKAEARDKVGRIVQYFCRFLQGAIVHAGPGFFLSPYKPIAAEVQSTLAWARRTNRWGKEMPHIPALGDAISKGDVLEALQRAVLITFLVQDHVYWLLKVGILKFEKYTPIQWHRRNLRFITLSHVLNFSLCLRDIMRIKEKQTKFDRGTKEGQEALEKTNAEIFDNKKFMLRYVLTFIQMIHVSQVKVLDDWYIGLMGMASAFIDCTKQW